MSAPRIGVGVPVWQGAAFVAETLECMLSQRGVDVGLFISVDGADQESERACRAFASDPRVRIVIQPQRLGWGENCAAALAGAAATGAPYVCLQPHDDLVDSDYLRSLVEVAEARPNAAVVYSDIRAFGSYNDLIVQPDVTGTPVERQLALLPSGSVPRAHPRRGAVTCAYGGQQLLGFRLRYPLVGTACTRGRPRSRPAGALPQALSRCQHLHGVARLVV